MLLLLQGPSDVALAGVANLIVKRHSEWRYLSPEVVDAVAGQLLMGGDELTAHIMVECVRSLAEDELHAVMPCPVNELGDLLREELGSGCITVLIAEKKDISDHDHHIVSKGKSAKKLYEEVIALFA